MAKKRKKPEYYGGQIKKLVDATIYLARKHPNAPIDFIHSTLMRGFEGYGKRESCFNCSRSMKITEYTADLHDGLLLLAMARKVRDQLKTADSFTAANQVHLPTLGASHATIKRNTKCDYLGFVKQPENWRGTGMWLITRWGWKALRGEQVPARVKYWEGNLIGRSDEMVTLDQMFQKHANLVHSAIQKRKAVRTDHRASFEGYNPAEWSEFAGVVDGQPGLFDR